MRGAPFDFMRRAVVYRPDDSRVWRRSVGAGEVDGDAAMETTMTLEVSVWTAWQAELTQGAAKALASIRLCVDAAGVVEGDGEDAEGAFALRGTWASPRLTLTKSGVGADVHWEGELDASAGELTGTWQRAAMGGALRLRRVREARRFALRPGQAEAIREALSSCGPWAIYVRTGVGWGRGARRTWMTHAGAGDTRSEGYGLGLVFTNVPQFEALPDFAVFAGLELEHLDIAGGKNNAAAVRSLAGLEALPTLRSVDASWCESLADASALSALTQLENLNLAHCEALRDLSGLAGLRNLETLNIDFCSNVKDMGFLSGLTRLSRLDMFGCSALDSTASLTPLNQLESLDVGCCEALTEVEGLASMLRLERLSLNSHSSLKSLRGLETMSRLAYLKVNWCSALVDIDALSALTELQTLNLASCSALESVDAIRGAQKLRSLNLYACGSVKEIGALRGLTALTEVNLQSCDQISDLGPLSGLTGLRSLKLKECAALVDLSPLAELTGLAILDISYCKRIVDLSPMVGLAGLQELNLAGCEGLRDLAPLSTLHGLKSLRARGSLAARFLVADLRPLAGLRSLETLDLMVNPVLTDLSPLSELPSLKHLDLNSCTALRNVDGLAGLRTLEVLELPECTALEQVDGLAGMVTLRKLSLSQCKSLRSLDGLRGLSALETLNVTDCASLSSLEGLRGLPALSEVLMSECPELEKPGSWEPLETLPALRKLDANLPAWFRVRTLASAAAARRDDGLIREKLGDWLTVARGHAAQPGLLSAVGRAAAVVDRIDVVAALVGLAAHHDAPEVDALIGVAAGLQARPEVREALDAAAAQASCALPPETLLALDRHRAFAGPLRAFSLLALTRAADPDASPEVRPAWCVRTAEALVSALDDPERHPCDWDAHGAVRAALDAAADRERYDALASALFQALAIEHARDDRRDDPDLARALDAHLRLRGLALRLPRGPQRERALAELASGLARAARPDWARERLDALLVVAAEIDPDTSALRAAVAEAHAAMEAWDEAERVAFDISRDSVRDRALRALDRRILASRHADRARRAVSYRAALSRPEERATELEALAGHDALGADPVAYGQLVATLAERPESQQRAVAAALRVRPEFVATLCDVVLAPVGARETALVEQARASWLATLLDAPDLAAGLRALGVPEEQVARAVATKPD